MLVLCDGGTETIWRTEELNTANIVNKRVLGREKFASQTWTTKKIPRRAWQRSKVSSIAARAIES